MIEISNLRIENNPGGGKRLIADIQSDVKRMDDQDTIWISVDDAYAYMLTDEVYDAFLFLPVYMSMYHHTDLHLRGNVSKVLYRNVVDYLQPIMCSFSKELTATKIIVDGFHELEGHHTVIGTGISCGVDCLSTVYKYFVQETDPDYKLTHLIMLNVGWHGEFGDPATIDLFQKRCALNKKAADEMGLPFVAVDSNLHAFLPDLGDRVSYFAIYTTVFALEKEIGKYYLSSSGSYDGILTYGKSEADVDFSGYADPMAIPLMQNQALRLIIDGCQYTRVQKTDIIADWPIARKYLNVCCRHSDDVGVDETNCSCCVKCNRTIAALDGLGKLDAFSEVFDISLYKKNKKAIIKEMVLLKDVNDLYNELYTLYTEAGIPLPSYRWLRFTSLVKRILSIPKRIVRKLVRITRKMIHKG